VINNTVFRLKRDILANEELEIKSTDLVNKSTLSHPNLSKFIFLQQVVEQCVDYCDCHHAAVVFKNNGLNIEKEDNMLPNHYRDILWRIEAISRKQHVDDTLVIMDNNRRKIDKSLAFAFNNYMYRSAGAASFIKVLPVPIFADSEITTGLQISDISAGIIRNYYANHLHETVPSNDESPYVQKLREYFRYIESRCIDYTIPPFKKIRGLLYAQKYTA